MPTVQTIPMAPPYATNSPFSYRRDPWDANSPARMRPLTSFGVNPFDWWADPGRVNFDVPRGYTGGFGSAGVPEGQAIGRVADPGGGVDRTYLFEVPESMRHSFTDPQRLHEFLTSLSPEVQTMWRSEAEADYAANQRREQFFQAALDTLGGARGEVVSAQTAFEEDPARAALREGLMERMGADYRLITERQEADVINQIAQAAARADSARQAAAAGRGVSTQVGAAGAHDRALDAIAAAQGLRAGAGIDEANALARERAKDTLADFTIKEETLRHGLLEKLNWIDAQIASIEAGEMPEAADTLAFAELDFGIRQFQELMEQSDAANQAEIEAEQFGLEDLIAMGLSSAGTGLWDFLL